MQNRQIVILTASLVPYDAVSNDVLQMADVLRESGETVHVFAEGVDDDCRTVANSIHDAPRELFTSPKNLLIYHHSIGWPIGEDILGSKDGPIIVRYHNITPARFFARYSEVHYVACERGIESTKRIAAQGGVLFVCDSDFNKEELVSLGAPAEACRVLPPLHLTEQLGREQWDLRTWKRYRKDMPNILFVGGIKPNKGHALAIEVLAAYRRMFHERARLIFAGSDPRIGAYREEVVEITREMRVEADVIFTGAIHSSALKTLYMLADAFLCLSEHEGFCVPLVEAMYFRVPIVAWGVTAVAETAADAAMLTETGDVTALAEHVRRCIVDREWAARLAMLGRERYEKCFHPRVLRAQLRGVVDEAVSGSAHGIARDRAGGFAD